jgi:hypothetical protein
MVFTIRLLNESDYDNTLVKWWKDWRWSAPPKEMLPNNGLGGFMVSKGDVDICAGFAFFTNSGIAFCEFIISNFEYKEDDRKEAIEFLIESISVACKNAGHKAVWTVLRSKSLIEKYENCGYKRTQENCTEMIKLL